MALQWTTSSSIHPALQLKLPTGLSAFGVYRSEEKMLSDSRPRFHRRRVIALLSTLFFGLICFLVSRELDPSPNSTWQHILASLLAAAFISVTTYEFLNTTLQIIFWRKSDMRAFDEFWGDDASERSGDGIIFLQSNPIDNPSTMKAPAATASNSINRARKARLWINACDTMGAQEVVKLFQGLGLDAPKFGFVRSNGESDIAPEAPFTISMGLGYSHQTDQVFKACEGWLRKEIHSKFGDAIALAASLIPSDMSHIHLAKEAPEGKASGEDAKNTQPFHSLRPLNWDEAAWLGTSMPGTPNDYAIILRHTDTHESLGERRKVQFVLAGFTERGTQAAGAYLAKNWKRLWRDYVKGRSSKKEGYGDFLLVIQGPSNVVDVKLQDWGPSPHRIHVTPADLCKIPAFKDCTWVARSNNSTLDA